MKKKLQYFNVGGLAEPIRYILHYTKQDFEDYRHNVDTWPDLKIKESLPYGQFPLYEEDGRVLTQALAIAKYVARDTELIPDDAWQRAVVDSAVYTIFDYSKSDYFVILTDFVFIDVMPYFLEADPVKKEELRKKLFDETIEYYFSRFSKQLSENGGYFIGKLSWGEFILTGIVESSNRYLKIELEKQYPVVGAIVDKIRNLPGVKEYIQARGEYKLPASLKKKMNSFVL